MQEGQKPQEVAQGGQKQGSDARGGKPRLDAQGMPAQQERKRGNIGANEVLVGKKPTMSYVLAAVTQFSDGMKDIHIKARGKNISRAVDVAEVVRKRFIQGLTLQIDIGTQEIVEEGGSRVNVSTIDIQLRK